MLPPLESFSPLRESIVILCGFCLIMCVKYIVLNLTISFLIYGPVSQHTIVP